MRLKRGWVPIWRSEMDDPAWSQLTPAQYLVWMVIRMLANVEPRPWLNKSNRTMEIIPRGSFVTTQRGLADECRRPEITRKVVRDALENLGALGEIRAQRRAHHSTLIQVVKYETYADVGHTEGPPSGPTRAQRGPNKGPDVRSREVEKMKNNRGAPAWKRDQEDAAARGCGFKDSADMVERQAAGIGSHDPWPPGHPRCSATS